MRPIPKDKLAGVLLLATISGAFIVTIGIATLRTSSHANALHESVQHNDVSFNFERMSQRTAERFSPKMRVLPASQVRLLAVTPPNESNIYDLPKVGKVKPLSNQPIEAGRYIWLQGPPSMCEHDLRRSGFDSNIHFRSYPLVPVTIERTSRPDIGVVRLPATYPEEIDHGTLTVNQSGHLTVSWYLANLPQTRETWSPANLRQSETWGPLEVEAKAWHDYRFPNGKVMVEMVAHDRCGASSNAQDTWVATRAANGLLPRYAEVGSAAQRFANTMSLTEVKQTPESWLEDLTYASIQDYVQLRGMFIHYKNSEEKVTFPKARWTRVAGKSSAPEYTFSSKPIVGVTSSGTIVRLSPTASPTVFRFSVKLPGGNRQSQMWLTTETLPNASGPRSDGKCEVRMGEKTATLVLHRRVEVEVRTYSIAVPIENVPRYSGSRYVPQVEEDLNSVAE